MPITTAVCPEIHNEEVARQVKAEQTNLLYRFGWAADWPSAAAGLGFLWVYWGADGNVWCAWCAASLAVVAMLRAALAMLFRRRTIPVEQSLPWQRGHLVLTLLLAIAWGSLGATLLRTGDWEAAALPAASMLGVAALALPLLSASVASR